MSSLSRNSLCSCGSGKKYKRCCMDKILEFPNKNNFQGGKSLDTKQFMDSVKEEISNKNFSSLNEVNEFLGMFANNYNETPKADFLGFSPSQIGKIIYSPFQLSNNFFEIKYPGDQRISDIPLMGQSVWLLKKFKDLGEFKATQKGFLPRALVREIYSLFFSNEFYSYMPNKEEDLIPLSRLKHLLELSGYIKKRKNKFSLTNKGELILEKNNFIDLFNDLFLTYANEFNWAFGDGFPDFAMIQQSAVFNLCLLHLKCQDWVSQEEIGNIYLKAFPDLIKEARGLYDSKREANHCFTHRFLENFCLPFGLLDKKETGKDWTEKKIYYKVGPLFKCLFQFNIK